jgi:hypothetical protein
MEVQAQPVPRLLRSFVTRSVRMTQDVGEERRVARHKDFALDGDQIIDDAPGITMITSRHLCFEVLQLRGGGDLEAQGVEDAECGHRQCSDLWLVDGVAARQGVRHDVKRARPVLHAEIESHQLASPLMLGNCRKLLVQQKLKTIVISANKEGRTP